MKGLQVGKLGNGTGHLADEATTGEVKVGEVAEPLKAGAWQRDSREVIVGKAKEAKGCKRE